MVSRDAVLAKAREWVGMQERSGNNDIWFSDDWGITGQSWCFAFVQSCFYYADPSPSGALPHQSMYCPYGIQWARDHGQAIEVGGSPEPGDIVFFSWDMANWGRWTPGTGDHVGLVEGWDGGDTIYTIEGNVGSPQGVWRKARSISGTVVCFWRPSVYDGSLGPAAAPAPTGAPDGHNVAYMQQFLVGQGINPGPVDGELGPLTAAGVTAWQQRIFPNEPGQWDGEWGPQTTARTVWYLAQQQPAPAPAPAPAPPQEEDVTPEQAQQLADVWNWLNPSLAGRKRADGSDILYVPELLDTLNVENMGGLNDFIAARSAEVAAVANAGRTELAQHVGGIYTRVQQAEDHITGAVAGVPAAVAKALPAGGGGSSEPVDVDAIIRDATPEQLANVDLDKFLAALGLRFSQQLPQQPKPPVVRPDDPPAA